MIQCEIDGTAAAEAAARRAFADSNGDVVALVGVVRTSPWFDIPAPAVGDRIRRFQRVESQLLRLAREAEAAGVEFTLALPGHEPVVRERERVAMRPAAA